VAVILRALIESGTSTRLPDRHGRSLREEHGAPLPDARCAAVGDALRPMRLVVLKGNLAPDGALLKVGLKAHVRGVARVFDSEDDCAAVRSRTYAAATCW